LAIYNREMQLDTEPGEFILMIGAASNDIRLRGTIDYQ